MSNYDVVIKIYHFLEKNEEFVLNLQDILIYRRTVDFIILLFFWNLPFLLWYATRNTKYLHFLIIYIFISQIKIIAGTFSNGFL